MELERVLELVRPILDKLNVAAVVLDAEGTIIDAKPAASSAYDWNVGERLVEAVEPKARAGLIAAVRRAVEGCATICRAVFLDRFNRLESAAVCMLPIARPASQDLASSSALLTLIFPAAETEPVPPDAEVRRLRALLQAVIDCIPFDFWALGNDGRYFLQNAVSQRHWGNAVGRRPEDVAGSSETLALWKSNNRRAMAGERIDEEVDLFIGGQRRRIRNIIAPIVIDDRIEGVMGINLDITDRFEAEQALQRACDELESRVRQRTAALSATNSALMREIDERRRAEEQLAFDIERRRAAQRALQRERRALKRLLESHEHDRQTIAYELHDGPAQDIAGAIMRLNNFLRLRTDDPSRAERELHSAIELLGRGHTELRRIISGVRPVVLDDDGLAAAIAQLIEQYRSSAGPQIELRNRLSAKRFPLIVENAAYRIIQEALNNAIRHSKSDRIRISLRDWHDCLGVAVCDWGVGFDLKKMRRGAFGLEGIRERVRILGGRCRIISRPGRGTGVIVRIPIIRQEVG